MARAVVATTLKTAVLMAMVEAVMVMVVVEAAMVRVAIVDVEVMKVVMVESMAIAGAVGRERRGKYNGDCNGGRWTHRWSGQE